MTMNSKTVTDSVIRRNDAIAAFFEILTTTITASVPLIIAEIDKASRKETKL